MAEFIQSYRELEPFVLSNVRLTGIIIGTGAYGSVVEAVVPGAICAAKKVHDFFLNAAEVPGAAIRQASAQFVRECQLMSTLRHPNIVQFLGLCLVPGSRLPALVMERLLTSLHDLLDPETDPPPPPDAPKPFFPLSLKCSILHDVVCGITYLHERSPPIIHRDLSARNVLLNSGMVAKIADLGVARIMPRMRAAATMTKGPGAGIYMPPEALESKPGKENENKKSKYDASIDVFSFGVVAIFTICQTFPCDLLAPTYREGRQHKARTELERRESYMRIIRRQLRENHPLLQMIKGCLDFPEERLSISEVLRLLEEARAEVRDEQTDMNKLELLRALQTQPRNQVMECVLLVRECCKLICVFQENIELGRQLRRKEAELAEAERQLTQKVGMTMYSSQYRYVQVEHSLQLFRKNFRDNETRLLNCWPRLSVRPLRMRILARFGLKVRKSPGFPSSS